MLIGLIIFCAFIVGAGVGFGSALISMPFLVLLEGIEVAAPLFALTAQSAGVMRMVRYRRQLQLAAVWRVLPAGFIGIPLGVAVAGSISESLVLRGMGAVVVGYALYALAGAPVPTLKHPAWAGVMGGLAGLLIGAYNVGGPPLVMYGNAKRWPPLPFKANMAMLFFSLGMVAIISHFVAGNITARVLQNLLIAVPAMAAGQMVGFQIDRFINPVRFRQMVLVLLLAIGARLLLTA